MTTHYFDYAASCPPFPEALDVFNLIAKEYFANPSSKHSLGTKASEILEDARHRFLELCNLPNHKLVLTASGTEANNFVIRGVMEINPKGHLLVAADVHSSAWFATELYSRRVKVVPIDNTGKIDIEKVKKLVKRKTVLLSIAHVCNETGVIHNLQEVSRVCQNEGIMLHVDGVQALGHVPLDFENTDVNFYTFSAHKFGGPRGIGGVLLNTEDVVPQIRGGHQEYNLRAGTVNLPGFLAALKALEISLKMLPKEMTRLQTLSGKFIEALQKHTSDFLINSSNDGLPGLVSLSFPRLMGTDLIAELSLKDFALSTGSACHAHNILPSRIIKAMGRAYNEALGTLRISMGRDTTKDNVLALVETLAEVVSKQRMLK